MSACWRWWTGTRRCGAGGQPRTPRAWAERAAAAHACRNVDDHTHTRTHPPAGGPALLPAGRPGGQAVRAARNGGCLPAGALAGGAHPGGPWAGSLLRCLAFCVRGGGALHCCGGACVSGRLVPRCALPACLLQVLLRSWRQDADGTYIVLYQSTNHRKARQTKGGLLKWARCCPPLASAWAALPLRCLRRSSATMRRCRAARAAPAAPRVRICRSMPLA